MSKSAIQIDQSGCFIERLIGRSLFKHRDDLWLSTKSLQVTKEVGVRISGDEKSIEETGVGLRSFIETGDVHETILLDVGM